MTWTSLRKPSGKRRAQRPVGEAAGEDRLLAGPALTAEERAGDLARGVHALLDVDGEGEEVDALAGLADVATVDSTTVSPTVTTTAPSARLASLPVSRVISSPAALIGTGYANRVTHGMRSSRTSLACGVRGGGGSQLSALRTHSGRLGRWRLTTPASRALVSRRDGSKRGAAMAAPRDPCYRRRPELGDERPVPLDVVAPEVVEQPTTATDEHEQPRRL